MNLFKVLVCGGRDYSDRAVMEKYLGELARAAGLSGARLFVIHGAGRGADSLCQSIAGEKGYHAAAVPALWDHYGKGAGPIRNSFMLALGPDLVLAFPGGRGTADMVRQASEAGVAFDCVGTDGELV